MIIEYNNGNKTYKWNLPLIAQYEAYEYSIMCVCPRTYNKDVPWHPQRSSYDVKEEIEKGVVGYCDTPSGLMLCYECPICGKKWRCHFTDGVTSQEWKEDVGLMLFLDHDEKKEYDKFLVGVKQTK